MSKETIESKIQILIEEKEEEYEYSLPMFSSVAVIIIFSFLFNFIIVNNFNPWFNLLFLISSIIGCISLMDKLVVKHKKGQIIL